jgi:hypothetical protein
MASPSATLNPINNTIVWMFFTLMGVASPGTIAPNGVKGFKRETGWDEKKGKGTQGATLTLKGIPPIKGSFTLQLFTPKDFADWDDFVSRVLSINPTQQQASGLPIYYPGFSSVGLTTVVVKHYSPPMHMGKGLYHAEVEFIEWQQPPAKSVVQTPSSTASDATGGVNPPPVDPRIAALQQQIALLTQAAKAP